MQITVVVMVVLITIRFKSKQIKQTKISSECYIMIKRMGSGERLGFLPEIS